MAKLSRRDFVQTGAAAGLGVGAGVAFGPTGGPPSPPDPWLVMLYLAGDNNLTEDMVLALQDIQAQGLPDGYKVVAQLDPSGRNLTCLRYDFNEPDTEKEGLERYRVKDFVLDESNTGNANALIDFIQWAHKKYQDPLPKTLLILSGHGSGITDDFFMVDNDSMDSLTIRELRDALEAVTNPNKLGIKGPIDILGMDACHMSMGEIAFEIREHVKFMIAAEGLEPEFGWPYRALLAMVHATANPNNTMAPDVFAKAIVTTYIDHYHDYDRTPPDPSILLH